MSGNTGEASVPQKQLSTHPPLLDWRVKPQALQTLLKALQEEMNEPLFFDTTVIVEGEEFKGHKVILSAMSDFFRALFRPGMKETFEKVITVGGISAKVYRQLLRWMYCAEAILAESNIFDVMLAANQLQIKSLLVYGKDFLLKTLSIENCVQYYTLSSLIHLSDVKEAAWNVILYNFNKVSLTQLLQLSLKDFKCLVRDPGLVTNSEDDVIETILRWIRESAQHSREDELKIERIKELIECSRYLLVSPSFLQTLEKDPIVRSNPGCRKVVEKMIRYKTKLDTHQHSCPEAAIQRLSNNLKDVILLATNKTLFTIPLDKFPAGADNFLDLSSSTDTVKGIAYYNGVVYILTYGGDRALPYYTYHECGNSFIFLPSQWPATIALLPVGDVLVAVHTKDFNTYTVRKMDLIRSSPGRWTYVGLLTDRRMKALCVTSVGLKLAIFWHHHGDTYVEIFNILSGRRLMLPDRLKALHSLACFNKHNEVFVLQDDGWLKQLHTVAEAPYVGLRDLKQLWVGKHEVKGALMVADCLHILGGENFTNINWCFPQTLEGVFSNILAVSVSDKIVGFIHAVIKN